ncbi:unnamed protein product, partial [marine sediment metagenome]
TFWRGKVNGTWQTIEEIHNIATQDARVIDRLFPIAEDGERVGRALLGCGVSFLEVGAGAVTLFYAYRELQWGKKYELEEKPIEHAKYKLKVGKYIIQCEADKQNLLDCNFTLRQNGGCAEFDFRVGRPDYTINLGDEVLIYLYGQATPWYRGRILERSLQGSSSRVRKYAGYGHFEFLNAGDLVDVSYGANHTIGDLRRAIIDILDTYVRAPGVVGSLINTPAGDPKIVVAPAYPIQEMIFDMVKPIDALTDLCELASG